MAKPIKPVIVEFLPVESGNLTGLFTVQVGPCEFRKCRLIEQPDKAPFCSPPQESYTDRSGQKKFVTLVKWPHDWNDAILAAMLEAKAAHPSGIKALPPPVQQAPRGRNTQQAAAFGGRR